MSDAIHPHTKGIIESWALHNCKPWLDFKSNRAAAYAELVSFNGIAKRGYVFHIQAGQVNLLEKPDSLDHIERGAYEKRSDYYKAFFSRRG